MVAIIYVPVLRDFFDVGPIPPAILLNALGAVATMLAARTGIT